MKTLEQQLAEAQRQLEEYKTAAAKQLRYDMAAILTGTPEKRAQDRIKELETKLQAEFAAGAEYQRLWAVAKQDAVREVIRAAASMSPEERVSLHGQIFGTFCRECFGPRPCHCMRDE